MKITGRALVFGDDIDTDVMMPGRSLRVPLAETRRMLFEAIRPAFPDEVRQGDILVGGHRFGTGSARPVALHLGAMGVTAIVAESMSSLFQRNSINAGVLAVVVPGVSEAVTEGDVIEVDASAGTVRVPRREQPLTFTPLPSLAMDIVAAGGVINQLIAAGYLPGP